MDDKEIDTGVSLYDFNRANMGQFPILSTEEELNGAKNIILDFLCRDEMSYYMLLNHETRYFTLFEFSNGVKSDGRREAMANDVIECMLNCRYGILDICYDNAGTALEVWVKDLDTDTVYMYLLFPYDFGVIVY